MKKSGQKQPKRSKASEEIVKPPTGPTVDEAAANIYGDLLLGVTKEALVDACRTKYPNLDPIEVLHTALDSFLVSAEESPALIRGWCLEATRHVYRQLLAVGEYEAALRAISQVYRLSENNSQGKRS